MSDLPSLPFMSEVAAQVAEEERKTEKAKRLGIELLLLVLAAEAATLPENIRQVRSKLLAME